MSFQNSPNLLDLPQEIIEIIFSFLDLESIINLSNTCKALLIIRRKYNKYLQKQYLDKIIEHNDLKLYKNISPNIPTCGCERHF